MRIKEIGEIALIKRMTKGLRFDRTVVKGPGDDAAVIEWTRDKYMLFASDMLVEGTHFTKKTASPYAVGWKALGRNLSDIAAMGGTPRYAVVSAGFNPGTDVSVADGISRGIRALADRFGVNIVGGDVVRSDRTTIDIAVVGEVEKNRLATRSGARPGDMIFVTGSIGGSSAGRHLTFIPRVAEARKLVTRYKVNAMIDVSDGLLLDLWRVLDASSVGARLYEEAVPLSKNAASFDKAVREGEDFELVFTMSAAEARRFIGSKPGSIKTPVSYIGDIMPKRFGYRLVGRDGCEKRLRAEGYRHF